MSGQSLAVLDVPATISDSVIYAYVRVDGARHRVPVLAERDTSGAVRIQVPLHPTTPHAGGAAELVLGGGKIECKPLSLSLQAPPAAPGTTERVATGLQESLQAAQEALGVSPEILTGDPNRVPPELQPLFAARWMLDHPQNPNSLLRLLDGSAPALQGKHLDPALLDAMLASSGVPEVLGHLRAHLATLPGASASESPGRAVVAGGDVASLEATQDTVNLGARGLNSLMVLRAHMEESQPQIEELLQKSATLFALTVVLPGLQPFAPAAAVAGGVFWIGAFLYDGQMKLLPTELEPLRADAIPRVMGEDAPANAGEWRNVRLAARSDDWTFTIPRVVGGLLSIVGGELGKRGAQAMQWSLQRLLRRSDDVGRDGLTALGEVINFVYSQVNQALQTELAEEHFYRPARVYGPVDASEYVEGYLTTVGVVRLYADDTRFFGPASPGTTKVGLQTEARYFRGRKSQVEAEVDVTPIEIRVSPASHTMDAGGIATFQARVEGAHQHDQSVRWSASGGWITEQGEYTAPPHAGTYTITAAHPVKSERRATATVQVVGPAAPTVVSITAGTGHACGVLSDGSAYCWGVNQWGTVGDGTTAWRLVATRVAGDRSWKTLSAESTYTCGISADESAYCWGGDNLFGQLGTPMEGMCSLPGRDLPCNPAPRPVMGDLAFRTISAGGHRTCALTPEGQAYCWGTRIGDGTTSDYGEPKLVSESLHFSSITTGGNQTCALTPVGKAYCWGIMVGDGTADERLVPTAVAGEHAFAQISASHYHICGVTMSGEGYCWGRNLQGRLGDGTTMDRLAPTRVAGGRTWAEIRTGTAHTCGRTTEGRVYCWGAWHGGGTTQELAGGLTFQALSAGGSVNCGITREGQAYCWGYGEGVMGDGTQNASDVPVAVKGW